MEWKIFVTEYTILGNTDYHVDWTQRKNLNVLLLYICAINHICIICFIPTTYGPINKNELSNITYVYK